MKDGLNLAAVDLGSNSFRLEVGRLEGGQIVRAEYLKETVRLGAGLDDASALSADAMRRGWECLGRFAERVRGFDPRTVRAVATQTLREARNRGAFVDQAQRILGFPIDVISGREEARLIYGGVCYFLPDVPERRLVFDIGGRSTEIILGQADAPKKLESYGAGSVELSMRFFADGRLTTRAFEGARVAAQAQLEGSLGFLAGHEWDAVYGASGTVGAVADILRAESMSDGTITPESLNALMRKLIDAGHTERVVLAGLKDDRRPVIGGGLSILQALCALLGIERIESARGALRHGVLVDMLSREARKVDIRVATVRRLQQKFGVDAAQAQRVAEMAHWLFMQLHPESDDDTVRAATKLRWAAELHEIGMAVSHDDYHRHGAYVLEHADPAGFAAHQLQRLAVLVLAQRGGLRKVEGALAQTLLRDQIIALRVALVLCHARRDPEPARLRLQQAASGYRLAIDPAWATTHPQSMYLLHEEAAAWSRTRWSVNVVIE
jgi:exopolyphosphatase/guanosine-5'-triphosphate,3'-diphosphate pyrophosphatase